VRPSQLDLFDYKPLLQQMHGPGFACINS